tara:strand:+ start:1195 stop:1716 length:522 start_codon:yes stop_codon:yes gene_type:complete
MIKSKKGAIELSMTTIIVVVIGVVLLGLGIGWITNLISQVERLTDDSFAAAQQTIHEQMPSGSDFYIAGYSFKTKAGKYSEIYSGVRFFDEDPEKIKYFKLTVIGEESQQNWFLTAQALPVKAGETKGIPIGVKVPSNIAPGLYTFTIEAKKSDSSEGPFVVHGGNAILLEVE